MKVFMVIYNNGMFYKDEDNDTHPVAIFSNREAAEQYAVNYADIAKAEDNNWEYPTYSIEEWEVKHEHIPVPIPPKDNYLEEEEYYSSPKEEE